MTPDTRATRHYTARRTNARSSAAELLGWIAYRVIRAVRLVASRRVETDPSNFAILCDAFLRYGTAQAIALREAGTNVTLYYVDRVDDFAGQAEERAWFLERARAAGVTLVPLPRRRMSSLFSQVSVLHRDLRARKIATAVIHSHIDPRYATLGFVLPVALVLHDPKRHSGDEASTFPLAVRLISRISEHTAACLILHSEYLVAQVRPALRRLPIGIVAHGAAIAAQPMPVPKQRLLLIFGRLFEYKGVDTALAAFRALPPDVADTRLTVAGQGPLAALARDVANVLVRDEYISESELVLLLENTRLVLLAYKDASQSGVGMQAIARGVPCIVSHAGGLPDLLPAAATGLIVPPDDPERLAEAIASHIDHDDQLRRAVWNHAAENFAWPVVAKQLLSELDRLGVHYGAEACHG
jgi:glycosyltransferase involved in cell wall biosynthesis